MAVLWSFRLTPTISTHRTKFESSRVPVIFEVMLNIDSTLGVVCFLFQPRLVHRRDRVPS